jgi:hypothetical protein
MWDQMGSIESQGKAEACLEKDDEASYEQLLEEIESMGFLAVGRKYGVSDNAVRKWVRFYERQREREAVEREAMTGQG